MSEPIRGVSWVDVFTVSFELEQVSNQRSSSATSSQVGDDWDDVAANDMKGTEEASNIAEPIPHGVDWSLIDHSVTMHPCL